MWGEVLERGGYWALHVVNLIPELTALRCDLLPSLEQGVFLRGVCAGFEPGVDLARLPLEALRLQSGDAVAYGALCQFAGRGMRAGSDLRKCTLEFRLYFHGFAVEVAEALAEYWHKEIRRELGIDGDDGAQPSDLFRQKYRGSRYSFGYPACPRLEDQAKLFQLLDPARINVSLTDEWQMVPEQSTSAIIVHHPDARYFSV